MQYSCQIRDHFDNPRNVGSLNESDSDVGVGIAGNAACGDILKLSIRVKDNIIVDVKFKTFGCASAIASSSLSTELIKGKTLEEASKVVNRDIATELELPKIKIHCSVLAQGAITKAIENYRVKQTN